MLHSALFLLIPWNEVLVNACVTRVFPSSIEVKVRVTSNSVGTQDVPTEARGDGRLIETLLVCDPIFQMPSQQDQDRTATVGSVWVGAGGPLA